MRYTVLLVGYVDRHWNDLGESEQQEWMQQHGAFDRAVDAEPECAVVAGEALSDGADATVFQVRDGRPVLTDGPFAEATEQIGGFYVVDAPDLDTLTRLLAVLPPYVMEIRPVLEY